MSAPRLAGRIAEHIRRHGPIPVAAFMAMALHDAQAGYYAGRDPLGRAGDFTTAPEISQIFGELIGVWCADLWQRMGAPEPVILAELGPGHGTLMQDLLRATTNVSAFHRALRLYLIEVSPMLRAAQQQRLGAVEPLFVDDIGRLPPGPLLLVANEFLDALPIRQLLRGTSEWAERMIGLDHADQFAFVVGPENPTLKLLVPPSLRGEPPGTIVEICPAAAALCASLGRRFAHSPGAALLVDYGYFPSQPGPTLSAVRRHEPVSVLEDPGEVDLSAHVDFAALAEAARGAGAVVWGPVPQGRFLAALGAEERLSGLSERAGPEQRVLLESGLRRLIDPAEMGTLFKTMAVTSPGVPAPAGFAQAEDSGST